MKFFLYIIVGLLLIQLIRPTKNIQIESSQETINEVEEVPSEISEILKRSCNDCHSNNTNYLWYHEIAPFSWAVAYHIKEGKEHLNFDAWSHYNVNQKKHIIENLEETIETREMPLVAYLKFHPEAVISEADNEKLLAWIRTLKKQN